MTETVLSLLFFFVVLIIWQIADGDDEEYWSDKDE